MNSDHIEQITEHLYRVSDTCQVYVIIDEGHALCIDFGSGNTLKLSDKLGFRTLDWILHTHHHRDQCQGDWLAAANGTRIAAPEHERFLFEQVENYWNNRRMADLYDVRNNFMALTQSVPIHGTLADYDLFKWRGYEFRILPTPGHTYGSSALLTDIDGKRVAFTGDLISSPGKVQTLYDLQYDYGSFDGVNHALLSLSNLSREECDMLCPSHGQVMRRPSSAIADTMGRLRSFYESQTQISPAIDNDYVEIVSGVFGCHSTCSAHYALVSESGKALLIDYGTAGDDFLKPHLFLNGEKQRFIHHSLERLREKHGVRSFDVAIPTHYHDDHICGFPYLQKHENTEIWCLNTMAGILTNPGSVNAGCILHSPLEVSKELHSGQRVHWEEFTFTVYDFPGHSKYHMALLLEREGKKLVFTGDNVFEHPSGELQHSLVFRNHCTVDSHVKMAKTLMKLEPDIICPGHGSHFKTNHRQLKRLHERMMDMRRHFVALIDAPKANMGVDIEMISLHPFQIACSPGDSFELTCTVRNHTKEAFSVEAVPVLPANWSAIPDRLCFGASALKTGNATTQIQIPKDEKRENRIPLSFEITINGNPIGQQGLAIVEMFRKDDCRGMDL